MLTSEDIREIKSIAYDIVKTRIAQDDIGERRIEELAKEIADIVNEKR